MSHLQQQSQTPTPALWRLAPGQALAFTVGPGARELLVTAGRVWLTQAPSKPGAMPEDLWLEAGQSLNLPSGEEVVLEAWPTANFQLLVSPCNEQRGQRAQHAVGKRSFSPASLLRRLRLAAGWAQAGGQIRVCP